MHSEVSSKRSVEDGIFNAETENAVEEPSLKCLKPGDGNLSILKEIRDEKEPPRFFDVGYNRNKVSKKVDKGKVMATVSLSARKKSLNDYLEMLLNLRESGLTKETDGNDNQPKLFLCCGCVMRFKTYTELRSHTERPTSRLIWRCTICWLSFETRNICQVVFHAAEYHINDLGCFPAKIPIELVAANCIGETIKRKEVCPECRQGVASIISHLWHIRQNDPAYHCPYCNVFFTRNICRYNLHIKVHKNTAPYRCPDCAKLFDNCADMLLHLNKTCRHAELIGRYKCSICELIFTTEIRLKRHVFSDHNTVKYKCHICPSKMNITSEKNKHYFDNHSDDLRSAELRRAKAHILSHSCAICGATGLKGYSYERHVNKHFTGHRFKMSIFQCHCAFTTIYKATYLWHKSTPCVTNFFSSLQSSTALLKLCLKCLDLKYFNGTDPFICERCEYQEKYWKRIYYLCLLCNKLITYAMEHVVVHLQKEHKMNDVEMAYEYVRKLPCIDLENEQKELEIVEDTTDSIEIKLDEDSSQEPAIDIDADGFLHCDFVDLDDTVTLPIRPSYCCNLCSESFFDKNILRSHYLTKHRRNRDGIPCLECGVAFESIELLSTHLRLHAINNTEVYLKQYGIEYNREQIVKEDDSDLTCSVCDQTFASPAKKTQHMRSHGMLFLKKIREM